MNESVQAECELLYNETHDLKDAEQYIDETVADVMMDHPHANKDEVETLVRKTLKELYNEQSH